MSTSSALRIAVFASGKGSNFEAILRAIEAGTIPNTRIVALISNNSKALALETARAHNIPALHISQAQFPSEEAFNSALLAQLSGHNVNFIVLAGYMKLIGAPIINAYRNRIVNVHPALLPAFGGKGMYGMHVHEAVIAQKAAETGASVHIVDDEYDRGPVIAQRLIPVLPDDTAASLAARVLRIEHELYPDVIRLFAEDRVRISGDTVTIIDNVAEHHR